MCLEKGWVGSPLVPVAQFSLLRPCVRLRQRRPTLFWSHTRSAGADAALAQSTEVLRMSREDGGRLLLRMPGAAIIVYRVVCILGARLKTGFENKQSVKSKEDDSEH